MITLIRQKTNLLFILFNIFIVPFHIFFTILLDENDLKLLPINKVAEISALESTVESPFKVETNKKNEIQGTSNSFTHKDYSTDKYLLINSDYLPDSPLIDYRENVLDIISCFKLIQNSIDFHSPPIRFV